MPRGTKRTFEQRVADSLEKVMKTLQRKLQKELQQQGHVLTGALRDSIQYSIKYSAGITAGTVIAEMTALDYGMIVEVGVPANKIPYGGRTGKGGTSKYIQGLVRFWQIKKGLGEREALRAAFATAAVHKREGMPSRGSYGYARNGERKNWIKNTLANNLEQVQRVLKNEVNVTLTIMMGDELEFEPLQFAV